MLHFPLLPSGTPTVGAADVAVASTIEDAGNAASSTNWLSTRIMSLPRISPSLVGCAVLVDIPNLALQKM